ncbi:hypothetical protein GCM10010174_70480 [Kutzneria viridogrisea]|uniref:Orc1-like AAA ATPase domain-containing protein n=1 Tax=Kutzneria viridogrisea TaxID=47990 RepID=A0ABR6BAS2_9PSEU|nr:ATP-binding protein [Kutzneria albida]MBA8923960.1 hypothetical protein [Kutzneria viridogrisea]
MLVLVPPEVPKAFLVDSLPLELAEALSEHNRSSPEGERIRLRAGLHAGEINFDEHGVSSSSINHVFRLMEAPAFKAALADSPGVLALVTSQWFYEEVVCHSVHAAAESYRRIQVSVKETSADAWIVLPDQEEPPRVPELHDNPTPVPRQLPVHTPHFVGRAEELGQLDKLLDNPAREAGTVQVTSLYGPAGIGKTTLALRWAHQAADRFPDGQLHVDLRGAGNPLRPEVALRGFLGALGVPHAQVPVSLGAQAALYRTVTTGRKLLVLLDNARDAEQVRPLLPASPDCLVLVTSRDQLPGLVVREGARPMPLDTLSDDESASLLAKHLGWDRVAAEPEAVAALVRRCGRQPLALAVAATRAALTPWLSLGSVESDPRWTLGVGDTGDRRVPARCHVGLGRT